jgi:hypothetical protein
VTNAEALKLVLAMAKGSASSEPDADKEAALLTTAQLIAIGMGKCPALQPPQQAGRRWQWSLTDPSNGLGSPAQREGARV